MKLFAISTTIVLDSSLVKVDTSCLTICQIYEPIQNGEVTWLWHVMHTYYCYQTDKHTYNIPFTRQNTILLLLSSTVLLFFGEKKMRWIMFLWAVWNMHVCISVTFGDISSTFSSKCQCWSLLYSQHQNGCEMDNEVNINFWMIFHLVIHLTN